MSRRTAVLLCCLLAVWVVSGCERPSPLRGDNGRSPESVTATIGPDGVQHALLVANDASFRFRPPTVIARPGKIEITLRDDGGTPHNLRFVGGPLDGRGIPNVLGGGSASITLTVSHPGTYAFVCSYHEALGMRGTLRVE
jgi:plastocyanin